MMINDSTGKNSWNSYFKILKMINYLQNCVTRIIDLNSTPLLVINEA